MNEIKSRWPGVFAKSEFQTGNRQSAIGNYTAFIHWPFQRENTPLGHAKEWDPDVYGPFDDSTNEDILKGRVVRMAGADEYLVIPYDPIVLESKVERLTSAVLQGK